MVANAIGAGLSLVTSLFNKKSATANQMASLKNNKSLYKYQSGIDIKNALKLLQKENAYNTQYMSNSAKATQALNQNLMDYQYALERQSRQTSYLDTRKDLETAGYNPLLAVGQQSNYTPVSSGASTTSQGVEGSQIGHSASQIASDLANVRNTTKTTNYLAKAQNYLNDLNIAKAELTRSQTQGQDLQNKADALYKVKQAFANLNLTKAQTKQVKQDIVESGHRILNMDANTKVQTNSAAMTDELVKFYRKHPNAALLFQLMNNVSGGNPLGTILNSATSLATKKMPILTKILK